MRASSNTSSSPPAGYTARVLKTRRLSICYHVRCLHCRPPTIFSPVLATPTWFPALFYMRISFSHQRTVSADTIVMWLWGRRGSQSLELNGKQNCLDQSESNRPSHNRTYTSAQVQAQLRYNLTILDQKYGDIIFSYCIQSLLLCTTPSPVNSAILQFS